MRIRLIVPVLTLAVAAPLAEQVAFFLRRGDEVRLHTAAPARDLPPDLAQLAEIVAPDGTALARRADFSDADLYIFYYAGPHPLADAVYLLDRGVVLLFCPLRSVPEAPVAEHDPGLLRLINAVDLVAVESEAMAQWLRASGTVQPGRLRVVPPAVSLADFSPDTPELELQRSLGLMGRRMLLAKLPADDTQYREALAAFVRRVRRKAPKTLLAFAEGGPPVEDGKFTVRLPVFTDPAQAYRLAEAFLAFDDSRETIQTALEAAACGLPLLEMQEGVLDLLLAGQNPIPVDEKAKREASRDPAAATAIRLLTDSAFYGMMARRSLDLAARYAQEAAWSEWGAMADMACGWLAQHERRGETAALLGGIPDAEAAVSVRAPSPANLQSAGEPYWTIADDLEQLKAMAHVMLKGYEVRSPTPVAGPLIAWVRRNLTSHLREPYIDPTLQRQEAFNLRVIAGMEELAARLDEQRRALDQAHESTAAALARAEELAAQVEALQDSLPVDDGDSIQSQTAAGLRAGLVELQRLLAGSPGRAVE